MSDPENRVLEKTHLVGEQDAIHFLGPEVIPALATPTLVKWMELACRENIKALLAPGEDSVGVSVALKHLAPTPIGMTVRVISRLASVQGRIYSFAVEAYDETEKIAEGTHERASVRVAKFATRLAEKKGKKSSTP
ncbi:MAG TPA: thioesterase family protein [Terriglobia bacterium]|jgi:predicted thioesterase|nr:thioesterase family protein [Terriglobia bacterium]